MTSPIIYIGSVGRIRSTIQHRLRKLVQMTTMGAEQRNQVLACPELRKSTINRLSLQFRTDSLVGQFKQAKIP